MSYTRIIPTLLLQDEGLVKTTKFRDPIYIGDPVNAVRIFNEKEVDELLLLDITASRRNNEPDYNWISEIVSESFMPLGYGGGIKTLEQVKRLFDTGIEKIIINSAMFNRDLINSAAGIYGSQSIVVCIDTKKSLITGYNVYTLSGSVKHKIAPERAATMAVENGAGEIIIQSIENEGTMKGFDIEITKTVSNAVDVPVVASGGAGSLEHLKKVVLEGNASAVAAGSLFIFKGNQKGILINYPAKEIIDRLFVNTC